MLISNSTQITFVKGKDDELLKQFELKNRAGEWVRCVTATVVSFTKTNTIRIDDK